MSRNSQAGFTLIEMVIIIVVLGIIAAAGIPRFINISTETLRATIAGTAASFQEAVILMQATVTAKGLKGPLNNVPGFGDGTVDVNTAGFPTDTASTSPANNNTVNSTKCLNVWNGILQNPPTITTSAAAYSTTVPQLYRAQYTTIGGAPVCRYIYRKTPSPQRRFEYYVNTGRVIVTNP